MASSTSDSTKTNAAPAQATTTEETRSNLPSLGALDEDDEFEEFEEQGTLELCDLQSWELLLTF